MNLKDILEYINSMVPCVLSCSYLYLLIRQWRFPIKTMRYLLLLCVLLLCTANHLIYQNFGYTTTSRAYVTIANYLILISFILSLAKHRDGRLLFIFLTSATFVLTSAAMGEIAGSSSTPSRLLIKLLIYFVITTPVCRYLRKPLWELLDDLEHGWYALSLIPFSLSALYMAALSPGNLYEDDNVKLITIILFFSTFLIYGSLYHVFIHLRREYQQRADYRFLAAQMNELQNHAKMDQAFHREMDIFRHDLRHFIQLQSNCLEACDIEGAKKGLMSMSSGLNIFSLHDSIIPNTGNLLIDSVLTNYLHLAQEKEINFTYKFKLPEDPAFDLMELAVIISNGLENAVHACEKIPSPAMREIDLVAGPLKKQFMLEISNTFCEAVSFHPDSHLPQAKENGHGLGTQSIQAFASKYNAFLKFEADEDRFSIRMII